MRSGICGNVLVYLEEFLSGRSLRVKFGGVVSSPRVVSQGDPQGSVRPHLFSIALAVLPEYLPVLRFTTIRLAKCADDIVFWCIGSSNGPLPYDPK